MTNEEMLREINSLPPEGQRLIEGVLASLRQLYARSPSASQSAADIRSESFIGMWRDRDDMGDSSEWVRKLREAEWGG
ncbi:MAG: hypothetical protein SF097_20180 [Acidobacteriota bacterium]|nr:hypothetical protein [Acidobacteriota bacterium]